MESFETLNADYIDAQYQRWKSDPNSLPEDWQYFFKGFELALSRPATAPAGAFDIDALKQARVEALIFRHRNLGHLLACMDPLSACPTEHPLLRLDAFDLAPDDLQSEFYTALFPGQAQASLKAIIAALKETYCRDIGVEYMHLQDPEERTWLQERMESVRNRPSLDNDSRIRILNKLCQSNLFEYGGGFLTTTIAATRIRS